MADPYVRYIGSVADCDDVLLEVGVDYDSVTIAQHMLNRAQAEEFAQLFVAACWEAAANAQRMVTEEVAW